MSKQKTTGDLVAVQPVTEVTVLPPNSGVVGRFLEEVQNMFKARAMRISGLLARINESGHRTELLLRMGAERMEAAECRLEQDLRKQGLVSDQEAAEDANE
jgi:hypothetical protein